MKKRIRHTIDGEPVEFLVPETEEDRRLLRRMATAAGGIGDTGDDHDPEDAIEDDWVDDPDDDFVIIGG